ncbi:hypothetical protein D3C76_375270 [compost metagenome]
MRYKPVRSQFCFFPITSGDPGAADIHFSRNAYWHGLQMLVQHIDGKIAQRAADDTPTVWICIRTANRVKRRMDRCLRYPIHVDQLGSTFPMALKPRLERIHVQSLSSKNDVAQCKHSARKPGFFSLQQLTKGRRCLIQDGNLFLKQDTVEIFR